MAAALAIASRGSEPGRALSFFRQSIGLLRNLSTVSTSPTAGDSPTAAKKLKRKKKKKNFFEVAQFLPNWGIGYHMAKTHWTGISYQITKINLYKDGRHGKAWGLVHKDGLAAADAPKKISGVHKRCWKYIPSLTNSSGSSVTPSSTNSTETSPPQVEEAQAA